MFTGIIREQGKVKSTKKSQNSTIFEIETTNILQDKKIGESIAVNGVCVTITEINNKNFHFEAVEETLNRSNLGELKEDDLVNLEPALRFNDSLDGHLVQGHIDATSSVKSIKQDGKQMIININLPQELNKYLAFKGSITINGVSLTVSDLREDSFSVTLIPHSIENSNLGKLEKGSKVNLEVDMIARYLERMLNNKEKEASYEFLKERNLL